MKKPRLTRKSAASLLCLALLIFTGSVSADNTGLGGTITYTDPSGFNPVSSPPYIGGYVVHTFTANGTLALPASASADVLVVAAGGGGGAHYGCGGGAGGLVYSNLSLNGGSYSVTVGAGGAGGVCPGSSPGARGATGNNSVFSTLTALGGGGGGVGYTGGGAGIAGGAGGSGGGGGGGNAPYTGGTATQPSSASGGFGNAGATGTGTIYGGGGGAGAAATSYSGGAGLQYNISGVSTYYAGGGGGINGGGTGGVGGGGNPGASGQNGFSGAANTGGGGGGAFSTAGGSGGSGIVIVKYPYVPSLPLSAAVNSPVDGQSFLKGPSISATAFVAGGTGPYSVTYHYKLTTAASYTATAAVGPFGDTDTFTQTLGTLPVGVYQLYATVADSTVSTATSVTNIFTVSPAALTITPSNQNGASPFTPTWSVATDSLIAGQNPVGCAGNAGFTTEGAGGVPVLTDGTIGPVVAGTTTNFATAGNGVGGQMLIYNLPASAYGYNLTNITVFSGWGNGGRHAQAYTLYYSTIDKPTTFLLLGNVAYDGDFHNPGSPYAPANPSVNRVVWAFSDGGTMATNVATIKFDFTTPTSAYGENGYSGYSEITVEGTPAASGPVQTVLITATSEQGAAPFTPDFVLPTDSLIAGQLPTTTTGDFTMELSSRNVASLTAGGSLELSSVTGDKDGRVGLSTCSANYVTCGGGSGSGSTLIYTLTKSINGSDVTNIVVFNGWTSNGRMGQYYTVSYSTVSAPSVYIPVTTVCYLPSLPVNDTVNRVAISSMNGVPLGKNVANLKFDFATPPFASTFDWGWQGYAQIIVEGTDSAPPPLPPSASLAKDILPSYAETFVGDQIVFTAAYSNFPPATVQWQKFTSDSVTNNINTGVVTVTNNGVITSTLTLNNVQLADTGSYQLQGLNGNALPSYSTAAPLVVSTPVTLGNIIQKNSGQCGYVANANGSVANFYPTWTVNTINDLILGSQLGGALTPGDGDFGSIVGMMGDPTVLSDGDLGYITYVPRSGSPNLITLGNTAGTYVQYMLPGVDVPGSTGYDLTNITVYGGWVDNGVIEQKYEVLYSTIAAPTTFLHLTTVDYNPTDTFNAQCASRTTLLPAGTALVKNVYAIQFNFNVMPRNGNWDAYSEIVVAGVPTAPVPVVTQEITPLTAEDVVGSKLTLTGGFSGATGYQWQKDGTNLVGQTTPTLTLSHLQLTDATTGGGYQLLAYNVSGTNATRGCTVVVDPAPVAVGNVATAYAFQTCDLQSFTPTWDVSPLNASLIRGAAPSSSGNGDFTGAFLNILASEPTVLTDGSLGTVDFRTNGNHYAFALIGNDVRAGNYVTYTLTGSANGYNITNITTFGGWNNNSRDQQAYTVYYATVASPNVFVPLAVVNANPANPNSINSVLRATITPGTGALATNVVALMFDMTSPVGENNYDGYSEIAVYGVPSAPSTATIAVRAANENLPAATAPDWVIESPNLIAGQLPSANGTGNFAIEANVTGVSALTDGTFGSADANASYATCGTAAGTSVTYTCTNGSWNLTNIVVYSGWGNYNRDGQFYNITYSTLADSNTFLPLVTVDYNPPWPIGLDGTTNASANRVAIAPANGATWLATNVYAVKFDFTLQGSQDHSYSGYAEIVLQGTNLPSAVMMIPPTLGTSKVSGGNLILTGTGGTPGAGYTWLSTTNLSAPINWTTNSAGKLDNAGALSNAIPLIGNNPSTFFRLRMP